MKQCPACRRQFPDDLKFCLEDGSVLVDGTETETQLANPHIARTIQGTRRSTYIVAALLIVVCVGSLVAAGAIGYFVYRLRNTQNIFVEPSPTPRRTPLSTKATKTPEPRPSPSYSPPSGSGRRGPKQISGGVLNGKATSLPKPPYPPAARAVRASGSVAVQVLVDEGGSVISASAVSGHPLLRAAAVSAARSARFNPTILSGQPVKVSGVITYNFVPPD